MVAEATSARFKKLHLQRKIFDSGDILDLMGHLEEELGARASCSASRPTRSPRGSSRRSPDRALRRDGTNGFTVAANVKVWFGDPQSP